MNDRIVFVDADGIAEAARSGGVPMAVLVVTRAEVERFATQGLLDRLLRLSNTTAHVTLFAGRVEILVQGYDDDPRELADIDAVRKFFAAVTLIWAKWWHFVGPGSLQVLHSLLLDGEAAGTVDGKVNYWVSRESIDRVVHLLSSGVRQLYAEHRLESSAAEALIARMKASIG